jgi:hypothetical protein
VAAVANGDGGEFAHYLIGPGHSVTQVTRLRTRSQRSKRDRTTIFISSPTRMRRTASS